MFFFPGWWPGSLELCIVFSFISMCKRVLRLLILLSWGEAVQPADFHTVGTYNKKKMVNVGAVFWICLPCTPPQLMLSAHIQYRNAFMFNLALFLRPKSVVDHQTNGSPHWIKYKLGFLEWVSNSVITLLNKTSIKTQHLNHYHEVWEENMKQQPAVGELSLA